MDTASVPAACTRCCRAWRRKAICDRPSAATGNRCAGSIGRRRSAEKLWRPRRAKCGSFSMNSSKVISPVQTTRKPTFIGAASGLLVLAGALAAQQTAAPSELTLSQAVERALNNYPSIRVTQEQMNAAAAGIRLAQTAYLPRVDGIAQINRATRNTFYGLLLPQSVIPGVDGVPANNFGSVWDSGLGVQVTWQPFDFGLRAAKIATATAERDQAQATMNRTRYDVSVA